MTRSLAQIIPHTLSRPMNHAPNRRQFLKTTAASVVGMGTALFSHSCGLPRAQSSTEKPLTASAAGDSSSAEAATFANVTYASGGTQAMAGKYPDPFSPGGNGNSPACTLTCVQSLGPCYVESPVRQDITEGKVGLPMRLALEVVDAQTCNPIENATVEVWSTDAEGVYSGQTPARMCSNGQPEARQTNFMRGAQITSNNGRADFDAVYPGWYPGRTPHIHLKVTVAGEEFIVTQLYFPDELSRSIYAQHPDYTHRPQADTDNTRDGLLRGLDVDRFLLNTQSMEDGALLAYTTIGLRSSTGEPLCRGRLRS